MELFDTYEALDKNLNRRIPVSGPIENAAGAPKLERYRLVFNAYYDLYNNGGGNPSRRTAYYFPKAIYWAHRNKWDEVAKITEPILKRAIFLAARECGLIDTLEQLNDHHYKGRG